jgi:protein AroM
VTTAVGVLTIGQAPRRDGLGAEISAVLGAGFRVIERGALDGLDAAEVGGLAPGDGDTLLVTLMADGRPVSVGKERILEFLQRQVCRLEEDDRVAATLLVCSGPFPAFRHRSPLVQPQASLYGAVLAVAGGGRVAALLPKPEQFEWSRREWRRVGVADPVLLAAEPYQAEAPAVVAGAARAARERGAAVLYLDCFGYDAGMRESARAAFAGPVVLARSMAARLLAEVAS